MTGTEWVWVPLGVFVDMVKYASLYNTRNQVRVMERVTHNSWGRVLVPFLLPA